MEVTKKNFNDTLPIVSDSIRRADFLVIDTEFTGLINGRDVSMFDSPEEYYIKMLDGATEFLLIQFGLCAFYWDEKKKHYMNDTYNFYLFPRGRPGPEKLFLCQSSSLDFLAAQGFDFNKLIREGITYMTEPAESRLRELLTERQKTYSAEKDVITIPEECKQQIDDICEKVRQFIDDNKSDEMEVERCNAFIRRLLFQELKLRFKKEIFVETKVLENKTRLLKVIRIKEDNISQDRDTIRKEKEWEELEDAVGFSKVARMISQSGKLVIGHNMLLDVLHTLNHFFQPLPVDYDTFKEFANCMFPKLLDTKYMSSLPPFRDLVNSSVLQHLLATLSESPFALPIADSEDGRGYTQTDDKHHEAGYDAYITGLCFLSMHSYLARTRGESGDRVSTTDSAILKPFLNKIFLAKTAHQDSPYMNLDGVDPSPSRDHVFHMIFPKEWQRNDIIQVFSPFSSVLVQFIDDTSALVALTRRDQARDVQRTLATSKRITLTPYVKYKNMLAKNGQQPQQTYWRKPDEESPSIKTPDSSQRARQAANASSPSTWPQPEAGDGESPPKTPRPRSKSAASPQSAPPRKRTSSGVVEVDDSEPPLKKVELTRSSSDEGRKRFDIQNGRNLRKTKSDEIKTEKSKRNEEEKKQIIIDRFDSDSKIKCVSAFKESDSWD